MLTSPLGAAVRPAALSLALALPLVACAPAQRGPGGPMGRGGPGGGMPPMPAEVAEVQRTTVRDPFRALGSLEAVQEAEIVAEAAGRVVAIPFAEGRAVGEGAVLARLDDREERAEVQRAEARLELARSEMRRVEELFTRDLASPRERDQARAALAVAEAETELQRTRLEETVIRAPFAGVAGRRLVSVGGTVRVGDGIARVARLDRLRVRFAAPERLASSLRLGAFTEVGVSAYPGRRYEGRVTVVEPVVDPQTRTFQVIAEIANRDGSLRPGMSADVRTALAERSGALTIPDEAVLAEGDQTFVYVVGPDSTVQRAPVRIGARDAARVEVLSGLEPGQRVVRAGHQKIFPGAKVMPIVSDTTAAE